MATIAKMSKGSKGFQIVKDAAADVVNAVNLASKSEGLHVYALLTLEDGTRVHVSGIAGRNPRRRVNRISQALKAAGNPVETGAIVSLKNANKDAVHVQGLVAADAAALIS